MANVGIEQSKLDNLAVLVSDRTGVKLPLKVDEMIDALGTLSTTTRDKWERPSDWPDLSKMDVSAGNILYMTSYADEARGFCDFYVNCTGNYTVEVGHLSGSSFVTESTETYSSGTRCQLYYGSANGTYKVLRVTGTTITRLQLSGSGSALTIGSFHGYTYNNGIVDVCGKLPSCTQIGFSNSYNLVNVDIPYLTFSTSASSAFSYCYSLVSVNTTGWNTSNVTNMSSMFYCCYSLSSLDVSGWNTGQVTTMSSIFQSCFSLASLDVSGWNTSNVITMTSMFANCASLASLDVSGWNTSNVTNMGSMFSYCHSLSSLDVSNFDTSKVTTMNSMFASCYSLISLDVGGWNTGKVTNMSSMFSNCASIASLDVSKFNTSNVTNMGSMFSSCYSLLSLDVSNFDTSKVTSMNGMFQGCYSLISLDVSHFNTSKVTTMSSMFSGCNSLTSLDVSNFNTSNVTTMNNMFINCFSIVSLDISKFDFTKCTTAQSTQQMFGACGLHGSFTIPSTVTYIGSNCFSGCRSLYEYHFKSTTPPTLNSTNAFNYMTDFGGKKIYVPSASLSAYQSAQNWSTYASYMVGE